MDEPSDFRLVEAGEAAASRPLYLVASRAELDGLADLAAGQRHWLEATGFTLQAGQWRYLPGADGAPVGAVVAVQADSPLWALAGLPEVLARGAWHIAANPFDADALRLATLGWALATYRFTAYKSAAEAGNGAGAELVVPAGVDAQAVAELAGATRLARDLINTPADDMGPSELAAAAAELAQQHGAAFYETRGEALQAGYPAIHTVGRAGDDPPRLLDLRWGDSRDPLLVLVGKGVCFDTGGLGLKPASGMGNMKKDMGGAAHVLALAALVMRRNLPVRLWVLVPAVENAVSGNAYRPGDIIATRSGRTVEVGHTDAEGRLVLADALHRAVEAAPAEIVDFATLTGAARVALGPDVPAYFSNREDLAQALEAGSAGERDPIWRLPLHAAYRGETAGKVADLQSTPSGGNTPGAIFAALFLECFVGGYPWAHFDLAAWNASTRPGRPEGGEAQGLRAALAALAARYPPRS